MSIQSVTNATSNAVTNPGFSQFNSAQFMQLLMTQLTHQNPLEPMQDGELMNQMASLNSLSELQSMKTLMTSLAATNQTSYAASLIGKLVRAERTDGSSISGRVDGVTVKDGMLSLTIGEQTIPLDAVIEIQGE